MLNKFLNYNKVLFNFLKENLNYFIFWIDLNILEDFTWIDYDIY